MGGGYNEEVPRRILRNVIQNRRSFEPQHPGPSCRENYQREGEGICKHYQQRQWHPVQIQDDFNAP